MCSCSRLGVWFIFGISISDNMKKLILAIAAGLPMLASAQILNPGFEDARQGGGPAHWGRILLIGLPCDVSEGYDSTYFMTTDAHTGNFALELRNAHCDDQQYFGGGANQMESDEFYSGFGSTFTDRPSAITLFYKLLPVGGDVGHVTISLEDDVNGNGPIASADFYIDQPATEYTSVSIPLTYVSSAAPSRITMCVGLANQATHVNFGSRLLIDDVSTLTTGLNNTPVTNALATIFPNPNTGTITIKSIQTEPVLLTVYNSVGQLVMSDKVPVNTVLSLNNLNAGIYHYTVRTATKLLGSGKMIKE